MDTIRPRACHRIEATHNPILKHLACHRSFVPLWTVSLCLKFNKAARNQRVHLAAACADHIVQTSTTSTQGVQSCCRPQAGQIDPEFRCTRCESGPTKKNRRIEVGHVFIGTQQGLFAGQTQTVFKIEQAKFSMLCLEIRHSFFGDPLS
ncbi:hypothetical protein DZK27_15530 [Rhodobacteraceae bacterium 63075]|nr:hypothetical protein DZK27_15530 [Rhodobacteraceae bacterium 63075]